MQAKMNSYGKTWHVWRTGSAEDGGDQLPLGAPMLAWFFNRDGEARPGLVETRDERMRIDAAEKRRERQELVALARPQCSLDALAGRLPGASATPPPGVLNEGDCTPGTTTHAQRF